MAVSSIKCFNDSPSTQIEKKFQWQHFWNDLDIHFDAALPPLEIRWVRIAGLLIKLKCRNSTLLRYLDIQLACCFVTDNTEEPDAVFYLWCGNIAPYLPEVPFEQRLHLVQDNIQRVVLHEGCLYAFDKHRNKGYLCLHNESEKCVISQGYLLYQLLYHLAKSKGRLMLHGALVGYEDKGVLICGKSGHGKSTLAISSLLQNCQYVSDDHLMLTRNGNSTCAWPVYSIASLYESTLARLPELQFTNRWLKDRSKHVFDISPYHHQFSFGLPVKALVFPVLNLKEVKPSCHAISAGPVLTHLIWSTIAQMNDRKDPEHIKNMLDFLRGLPCYQVTLSSDIELNAKFLKKFIINQLK